MKKNIGFALNTEIPYLKEIWKKSFNDEENYIDFYFNRRFKPEETLVYREDSKPLAMLTMMNVNLKDKEGIYIYAVATLPQYRGKGICRNLMDEAQRIAIKKGKSFSCLVPQEENLISMYRKMGYDKEIFLYKTTILGEGKEYYKFKRCSFENFSKLRERYLDSFSFSISHPVSELKYVYDEITLNGGNILLFSEDSEEKYVAFNFSYNSIYIKECSGSYPQRVAKSLMQCYKKTKAEIKSPYIKGEKFIYGMAKFFENDKSFDDFKGYMSLMLD